MNRSRVKKEVLGLLEASSPPYLFKKLHSLETEKVIGPLFSGLCNPSEKVRWNAVRAFGYIVPELAERSLEKGRVVMRRFLWSLNDESGGIGWGSPEAMAEVMCNCTVLRQEYLHMLISYMHEDGDDPFQDGNYLELPMLQRGLLWGVGRLCERVPQEMEPLDIAGDLKKYLKSPDPYVAGNAMLALSYLSADVPDNSVARHLSSTLFLRLYIGDSLREVALAELARLATRKISLDELR